MKILIHILFALSVGLILKWLFYLYVVGLIMFSVHFL